METFLNIFNWVMLIMCAAGFFKSLYNEQWLQSAISGLLFGVFVFTMFFYH